MEEIINYFALPTFLDIQINLIEPIIMVRGHPQFKQTF